MLKIISILTLLYFLSSTALADSNNNDDAHQGYSDSYKKPLPLHLADAASRTNYEAGGKQVKPCSKLHDKDPLHVAGQELLPTPTYTARIIKTYPGNTNNFKPQSLKNVPDTDAVEESNKLNYENDKANRNKLEEANVDVKNANAHSDQSKSEKENVETKADSGECYACSSLYDDSCFSPDSYSTGIKYCNGNQCITKVTSVNDQKVVIRDCGNDCTVGKPESVTIWDSCTVCSGDLCNDDAVEESNKLNYENDKADRNKLEEANVDVKNANAHSDQSKSEKENVETKADSKELDRANHDYHSSKLNSKKQGALESETRNAYAENDKSDESNYEDKNTKSLEKESGEYNKVGKTKDDKLSLENEDKSDEALNAFLNEETHLTKNLHEHSKEIDEARTKYLNKYLTVAKYNGKVSNYGEEKVEDSSSDKSDSDEQSEEGLYYNSNKGLYYRPNKNKVHSDESDDDEVSSETNRKGSRYSDELEDTLYGVQRNRADSDELNDALYEIRKHLDHSEELINALKEVGRKGKTYSNVLNNALYKVKKHKDESEELNKLVSGRYGDESSESDSSEEDYSAQQYERKSGPYLHEKYEKGHNKQSQSSPKKYKYEHLVSGRYGDESSESDSSEEDYSAQQYERKSGPYLHENYEKGHNKQSQSSPKKYKYENVHSKHGYRESDEESRVEDSDEDSHKCPSSQVNLVVDQLYKNDATRRLLSDSEDPKSALSESASSEDEAAKDGQNEKNVGKSDLDKEDSKSVEDKESQENKSNRRYVAQKDAKSKNKAKADDNEDSQTAEEKEGEDDGENYKNNVNGPQGSAAYGASQLGHSKAGYGYNLPNPAQGPGVSELSANGLNQLGYSGECYACSSLYDDSCFSPDSYHTRIKYCNGNQCITKVTSVNDQKVVIRDCGNDCTVGKPESVTIWDSCTVCSGDLCNDESFEPNGAFSINSQSLMFTVFVMFAIKLTM